MRFAIIVTMIMGLSGCGTSQLVRQEPPSGAGEHELMASTDLQYMSCNEQYFEFLTDYSRQGAQDYFLYALMANNAYEDSPQYEVPGWTRTDRYASKSGLSFDVYRREGATPEEIVVAFRGTQFSSWDDWKANIALYEPRQVKEAFRHVADLRAKYPDAKLTVAGHSLGAAIAYNMSLRLDGVAAVGFNASPMFFYKTKLKSNPRAHLYEAGEILGPFNRTLARLELPELVPYKYNFMDFLARYISPVSEHSMYLLSRGLLIAAVHAGSPEAREVFTRNIKNEDARRVEWKICAPLYTHITSATPMYELAGRMEDKNLYLH